MKKSSVLYHLIWAIFLLIIATSAKSQPVLSDRDAKLLFEKIVLATDREIYCVDDEILVSAFNASPDQLRSAAWSNVLYVELIDNKGTSIVQKKLDYNANGANGQLKIPNWLLTGNYYLRAYTRWMRNFLPDSYAYKMISVINPYRPELLEDYSGKSSDSSIKHFTQLQNDIIHVRAEKKEYDSREQVNFEISADNKANLNGKLVVSVIPKGTEIKHVCQITKSPDPEFTSGLIPETRGVSVSGKIINETDSMPLTSALVGLTVLNGSPENLNIMTDAKGRFYFDLNHRDGESEIFISAKPTGSPAILVDNDFSSQSIDLPFVPINFSPESKALYRSLMLNAQIRQRYAEKQDSVMPKPAAIVSEKIFYGDPEFIFRLADYIAMPTVQDYFFELIRSARIKKEGNKHVLKVINKYGELENYEPLILLDMVSVFDLERILELKPEKLDRIEIITSQFIRGNITYGGIISFFSKKHDLAGIDLPASGRFITYKMLSEVQPIAVSNPKDPRIPDRRSCLYWNNDLRLKNGETLKLSFSSGDNTGEYLIVVQRVDQSGQLMVTTSEILIK